MTVTNGLTKALRLKVLFCGSDRFSLASLRLLQSEMRQNPDLISDIQVLCKDEKPSGRGMKAQREIPTALFAKKHKLQLHKILKFKDWEPSSPIDLIIAVSFGLFIPSRLIGAATYGSINVHPSLLPRYRGPAPIHHAILNRDEYTGVTVQTLDTEQFDHGRILARSGRIPIDYSKYEPANFSWSLPARELEEVHSSKNGGGRSESKEMVFSSPFEDMNTRLANEGAELLLDTVRKGLFLPLSEKGLNGSDGGVTVAVGGLESSASNSSTGSSASDSSSSRTPSTPSSSVGAQQEHEEYEPSHALKLDKQEAWLDFDNTTAEEAVRKSWVMGHVYCFYMSEGMPTAKRLLLRGLEQIPPPAPPPLPSSSSTTSETPDIREVDLKPVRSYYTLRQYWAMARPGPFNVRRAGGKDAKKLEKESGVDDERAAIKLNGGWISVRRIQSAGKQEVPAAQWVKEHRMGYQGYSFT